jgi:hypothetical protein
MYESGGHGFGMTPQGKPIDSWPSRLEEWLTRYECLPRTS